MTGRLAVQKPRGPLVPLWPLWGLSTAGLNVKVTHVTLGLIVSLHVSPDIYHPCCFLSNAMKVEVESTHSSVIFQAFHLKSLPQTNSHNILSSLLRADCCLSDIHADEQPGSCLFILIAFSFFFLVSAATDVYLQCKAGKVCFPTKYIINAISKKPLHMENRPGAQSQRITGLSQAASPACV